MRNKNKQIKLILKDGVDPMHFVSKLINNMDEDARKDGDMVKIHSRGFDKDGFFQIAFEIVSDFNVEASTLPTRKTIH